MAEEETWVRCIAGSFQGEPRAGKSPWTEPDAIRIPPEEEMCLDDDPFEFDFQRRDLGAVGMDRQLAGERALGKPGVDDHPHLVFAPLVDRLQFGLDPLRQARIDA